MTKLLVVSRRRQPLPVQRQMIMAYVGTAGELRAHARAANRHILLTSLGLAVRDRRVVAPDGDGPEAA